MLENKPRPLLILVSAPSGAGKTTLCERLLADFPEMAYSVSCTTRNPREGEVDGESYNFLSETEFEKLIAENAFLEHARVFDFGYGTLMSTVENAMRNGHDVLMDVDVQGAEKIRAKLAQLPVDDPLVNGFVDVFIAAPSLQVLRARLEARKKDAPEVIARRLQDAEREVQH